MKHPSTTTVWWLVYLVLRFSDALSPAKSKLCTWHQKDTVIDMPDGVPSRFCQQCRKVQTQSPELRALAGCRRALCFCTLQICCGNVKAPSHNCAPQVRALAAFQGDMRSCRTSLKPPHHLPDQPLAPERCVGTTANHKVDPATGPSATSNAPARHQIEMRPGVKAAKGVATAARTAAQLLAAAAAAAMALSRTALWEQQAHGPHWRLYRQKHTNIVDNCKSFQGHQHDPGIN
jgi:hypothetical protein